MELAKKYLWLPGVVMIMSGMQWCAQAQTTEARPDSLKVVPKKISTSYVTEDEITRHIPLHQIDTNPNAIELFHNLYRKYTVFQDLGNIGSPSRPLLFSVNRPVGFRLSENPWEGYWMKQEETRYYNTKTPYSDLSYAQGANELLYLLVRHSQNILPRWNIGGDLQRISSVGFLARQYTSMYNYQFFTRVTSKNQKYDLIAHATWNKGVVEESGGVQSDSVFESLSGANKKVAPAFLNSQTRFKGRTMYLRQYWRLGKLRQLVQGTDTVFDMRSKGQFSHSVLVDEVSYIFEGPVSDASSLYPPYPYYDITETTFDSTYVGKLDNRFAFDFANSAQQQLEDSSRIYSGVGLTYSRIVTSQNPYVRNYDNIIADGSFEKRKLVGKGPSMRVDAAYNIAGFNQGDYKVKGFVGIRAEYLMWGLEALHPSYRPDYSMLRFKTNQFIWDNESTFGKVNVNMAGLSLSSRKFRNNAHLILRSYELKNWVYANLQGRPAQAGTTILLLTAELQKTFQVGRVYFEHYLIYQKSDQAVIRVPELSGRVRYYYQARFKKMKFQLGVDAFYNTAYYANAYSPASRMFYLQDDRKIGNYPVIDPFGMGEIKRAAFWLKYEHANQDIFGGKGYYYTPHYPLSLSSVRFGIRWRFYD